MTSIKVVLGFIFPLVLMSFCLLNFLLPDSLFSLYSFACLLIIFAYICTLSFTAKKKNREGEFKYAYWTIAIPFILGLLFVFTKTLQRLDIAFLNRHIDFDNVAFPLFLGGFVSAIDVVGTIRLFYNPYDPNPICDFVFVFIITAILLITPLLIYKFTKPHKAKATQID